jgi:hypothetical protein
MSSFYFEFLLCRNGHPLPIVKQTLPVIDPGLSWELGSPSCLFGLGLAVCVVPKLVCCCWGLGYLSCFLFGFGSVLGS